MGGFIGSSIVALLIAIFGFHHLSKKGDAEKAVAAKNIETVLIVLEVLFIVAGIIYLIVISSKTAGTSIPPTETSVQSQEVSKSMVPDQTEKVDSSTPSPEDTAEAFNTSEPDPTESVSTPTTEPTVKKNATPKPTAAATVQSTPTPEPTIHKTPTPTSTKKATVQPSATKNQSVKLSILVKQLVLRVNYTADDVDAFADSGYNGDEIFDITIQKYNNEQLETLQWSRKATMVNPWEYTCLAPSSERPINIFGSSADNHKLQMEFTGIPDPTYTLYYIWDESEMLNITVVQNTLASCKEISNLDYQDGPGYNLFENNHLNIRSLYLRPGRYKVIYNDGSSKTVTFTKSCTYDFTE